MNIIGLTGSNMRAMADVAEYLLAAVTQRDLHVAVMLYVENAHQVQLLRLGNTVGITEIWRVGIDARRPDLDRHLDANLPEHGALEVRAAAMHQLDRFEQRLNPCRAVQAAALATL